MNTTKIPARASGLDRFLIFILAGTGLLLVLSLITLLVTNNTVSELPATSPGGVVQRFMTAINNGEYRLAYGYLSDQMEVKPSLDEFSRFNAASGYNQNKRAVVDSEKITGDTATVVVRYYYDSGGPFGSGDSYTESFRLQQENGNWRFLVLTPRYTPYYYPYK
jgi:hypothetical protein